MLIKKIVSVILSLSLVFVVSGCQSDKDNPLHGKDNILMLHRCYNDIKNPNRNEFAKVVKALKNDKSVSIEIKDIIDEYDWD